MLEMYSSTSNLCFDCPTSRYFLLNATRDETRTLIGGGGGYIHIFMFCPTSFFSNQIQISQLEKKSVGQNMNI